MVFVQGFQKGEVDSHVQGERLGLSESPSVSFEGLRVGGATPSLNPLACPGFVYSPEAEAVRGSSHSVAAGSGIGRP